MSINGKVARVTGRGSGHRSRDCYKTGEWRRR